MVMKYVLTAGKILYITMFVLLLPLLLILWAIKMESVIRLPAFESSQLGILLIIFGSLMMLFGVIGLFIYGKGLPMSPFPPLNYVTKGIYKFISHPIYTGACLLTSGISIYCGSASGLWLISPFLILSCITFVVGFERKNLAERFPEIRFKTDISIPDSLPQPPSGWDKISAYILVLIPWYIFYRIALFWGMPDNPIVSYLPYETSVPASDYAVIFCLLVYPLVILCPLFAKTKKDLRDFMVSGLMATAAGFYIFIIFPFITPPKTPVLVNLLEKMPVLTNMGLSSYLTFPSFHVIWTFISISIYINRFPAFKYLWQFMAIAVSISCITAGMYSVIDVLSGFSVYLFVNNRTAIWRLIRKISQYIANSWKEWNFGPVRMINHGLYGGSAIFIGIFIVGTLLGKDSFLIIIVIVVFGIVGSALWAQFLEGCEKLLRPLGFYGGVIGCILGCLTVSIIFDVDLFFIFASCAVAAPWIQAIGRLRCLVQGCCHGRIAQSDIGIRYCHHRSRVIELSKLQGKYLHPTPVYSILANIVYGIFLIKLWFSDVPLPIIIGLYLILNGLSRFVEESYRGEPQTPIIGGLRLYQWIAMAGTVIGVILTTIPHSVNRSALHFSAETLITASVAGLLGFIISGVDFPHSNKRFSRLV